MTEPGISLTTKMLLKFLSTEKKEEMIFFENDRLSEEYIEFKNQNQLESLLRDIFEKFISTLSENEKELIRYYTGTAYKEINAVMRKNWTYEENGLLTEKKKQLYETLGKELTNIINKCPSLNTNIKTYRGVSLQQFKEYGIKSLSDLKEMEGKYFYDQGYTSTSLIKNNSLVGIKNFFCGERNIEMEYLIPSSCQDGALLLGSESSYYSTEQEYLINNNNLIKIISVEIDEKNNKAFMKALLLPKTLWNSTHKETLEREKNK